MQLSKSIKFSLAVIIAAITLPVLAQDQGDLIAWWPLDEPYGVRYDSHGDHDLTDNNTVLSATGVQGGAAAFNADNSEYLSYHGTLATGSFTAVAWVKRQGSESSCSIISDGWSIDSVAGTLRVAGSETITHTSALPLGGWAFVALSYANPTATLTLNAQSVTGTLTLTHGSDLQVGPGCTAYIDEVAVWDRALSDSEIAGIYNSGVGITYGDLSDADTYTAYMPLVARNATPGSDWGVESSALIVIDYENDTSWWEWATAISKIAMPTIGWLSEARSEIDNLMSDAYLMEFDVSQIDRYDMSTLAPIAGADPLDISTPSLVEQASNMGHAMGQPFAWIRESNRYLQDFNAWWMIALTTWMLGAIVFIVFVYTVSITIKLVLWFIDLVVAGYHLIPFLG